MYGGVVILLAFNQGFCINIRHKEVVDPNSDDQHNEGMHAH